MPRARAHFQVKILKRCSLYSIEEANRTKSDIRHSWHGGRESVLKKSPCFVNHPLMNCHFL